MLREAPKKSFRHLLVVTLVAGGLAVGVLGAPAHAAVVDPCTLVTTADLQTASGLAFGPGASQSPTPEIALCRFPSTTASGSFDVEVTQAKSVKAAKTAFKNAKYNAEGATAPVKVKGVGNQAFYAADLGDALGFRKGKTFVTLRFVLFGGDGTVQLQGVAVLTAVGKIAAANIPK